MKNPVTMTNAEYHANSAVSKSDLDLINRSPAHYRYVKDNPGVQTAAMLLGSVLHKLVLEPETFDAEYAVCPAVDRRTKAGKEVYQAFINSLHEGVEVITDDVYKAAQSMSAAVKSHPIAAKLLQGGQAESSYFWEENGVECKCRPDYLRTDIKCVIDLKTTQNASPESFVRSAYDYRYHVQAAWYLRGLRAVLFRRRKLHIYRGRKRTALHGMRVYCRRTYDKTRQFRSRRKSRSALRMHEIGQLVRI